MRLKKLHFRLLEPTVVAHDVSKPLSLPDVAFIPYTFLPRPRVVLEWLVGGSGVLTSPMCDHGAFVKTDPRLPEPDLQVRPSASRLTCVWVVYDIMKYVKQIRMTAIRGSLADGTQAMLKGVRQNVRQTDYHGLSAIRIYNWDTP
jgi:hypothetical protein